MYQCCISKNTCYLMVLQSTWGVLGLRDDAERTRRNLESYDSTLHDLTDAPEDPLSIGRGVCLAV